MDTKTWVFLTAVLISAQARSVSKDDNTQRTHNEGTKGALWAPPDGRSRDEWLKYHGQTLEEIERVRQKLIQISLTEIQYNTDIDISAVNQTALLEETENLDDCIWLLEYQADEIIQEQLQRYEGTSAEENHHREKRKIEDFERTPRWKWTEMPIEYMFDGNHDEDEREIIRDALHQWEDKTCIEFKELEMNTTYIKNHVLFTAEVLQGCRSFVGKAILIPQQLNLQSTCLWEFGIPLHEIGHIYGLWHEQQRNDRDDYIRVLIENVGAFFNEFSKIGTVVDLGVPYDIGSVMHYSPKAGSKNSENTMETIDPLYQQSMGQRAGLSFLDAKIVNMAYCADKCKDKPMPVRASCKNTGYQDPKHCERCLCPDGFSGKYCDELQPPINADCGGVIEARERPRTIMSPGYERPQYYNSYQQCHWLIKAPANMDIILTFEDDFGVYCHSHGRCYHWVEVRYKGNIGEMGPRFCCFKTPNVTLRGQLGEIMVILKTDYNVPWRTQTRGFKATFFIEPHIDLPEPTKKTTSTTTTTPATTTSTTTRPTTTSPTTTSPPTSTHVLPSGEKDGFTKSTTESIPAEEVWHCYFENHVTEGTWCSISQDTSDDFDWLLHHGATPSHNTGPVRAHSLDYYIFIEASEPCQKNYSAIIWLPDLHVEGTHCIRFYYHMLGFHINTLEVLHKDGSTGVTTEVWKRFKEIDRHWHPGDVALNLKMGDRIGFNALCGQEYSGDIALDDVYVHTGNCDNFPVTAPPKTSTTTRLSSTTTTPTTATTTTTTTTTLGSSTAVHTVTDSVEESGEVVKSPETKSGGATTSVLCHSLIFITSAYVRMFV